MSVPIRIRKSTTPGNAPSSLDVGEVAINEPDETFFYRNGSGDVMSFPFADVLARLDVLEREDKFILVAAGNPDSATFNQNTEIVMPITTIGERSAILGTGITLTNNEFTGIPAGRYRALGGAQIETTGGTRGFAQFTIQVDNANLTPPEGIPGHSYGRGSGAHDGTTTEAKGWFELNGGETVRIACIESPGSTGNGTFRVVANTAFFELYRLGD